MRYENYESDLVAVQAYMANQGIQYYTVYPANNCVGVSYGRVEAYAIVREGKVVEFMID